MKWTVEKAKELAKRVRIDSSKIDESNLESYSKRIRKKLRDNGISIKNIEQQESTEKKILDTQEFLGEEIQHVETSEGKIYYEIPRISSEQHSTLEEAKKAIKLEVERLKFLTIAKSLGRRKR